MVEVVVLIVLGVSVSALLLGAVVWKKRKGGNSGEVDYMAFFIMGAVFLPVGVSLSISTKNSGLLGVSGLGAAYLAIGLANRDKWKK